MSEKYYVVSDAEFDAAIDAAMRWGDGAAEEYSAWKQLQDAKDACRTREVPEWATHFAAGKMVAWQCSGADGEMLRVTKAEEIKL